MLKFKLMLVFFSGDHCPVLCYHVMYNRFSDYTGSNYYMYCLCSQYSMYMLHGIYMYILFMSTGERVGTS